MLEVCSIAAAALVVVDREEAGTVELVVDKVDGLVVPAAVGYSSLNYTTAGYLGREVVGHVERCIGLLEGQAGGHNPEAAGKGMSGVGRIRPEHHNPFDRIERVVDWVVYNILKEVLEVVDSTT